MSGVLDGRRALITGGGTGIGAGIALALARAGADVAVHHFTSAPNDVVAQVSALGRGCVALRADLTSSVEATALVDAAAAELGGLDILVANAGHLVGRARVAEMTDEHWAAVFAVNVSSAFYVARAAIPHLTRSAAGRIVTMSSLASENGGGAGAVAYAAAKAAVNGFTQALAKELAPNGVTVNAVAPGFIEGTPFHDTFTADSARSGIIAGIPLGRGGTPDDVASAVEYLASERAGFITGQVIDVNGGVNFR